MQSAWPVWLGNCASVALFAVLLATAEPALAQTSSGWVSACVFADLDRTWTQHVPVGFGGGFAAGGSLSPRVGIEFALDWPIPETVRATTGPNPASGGALQRYTVTTTTGSVAGIGAMAFRIMARPRFSANVLAGLSLVSHHFSDDSLIEYLGSDGNVVKQTEFVSSSLQFALGIATGLEAVVRIGDHLAVVPEVHLVWFPGGGGTDSVIVRPAVGIRWSD